MRKPGRPMGIMASFSTVSFKKDGKEVFSASVTSGGCFGPDDTVDVINRGYDAMKTAINEGKATTAALDFNSVSVGQRSFDVTGHSPVRIERKNLNPAPKAKR
ncbi:MAG: hypothetical protein ACAH80_08840 [Alphaproteobacteria bacterium]